MNDHQAHAQHHPHDHDPHEEHDPYRNPKDLKAYLARLEGSERAKWQKPEKVIRALGIKAGQTIAEIGPGPGYFTFRLAKAVGKQGRVLAAEVEPKLISILRERLEKKKVTNVTPVLGMQDNPLLPQGIADQILIVNTFHHFPQGLAYLRNLKRVLKPKGRLVNIDFHGGELPMGPPPEEKLSRDEFVTLAQKAGYKLTREHCFLDYQYFVTLTA